MVALLDLGEVWVVRSVDAGDEIDELGQLSVGHDGGPSW